MFMVLFILLRVRKFLTTDISHKDNLDLHHSVLTGNNFPSIHFVSNLSILSPVFQITSPFSFFTSS